MADTLGQNETLVTGLERSDIVNAVTTPSSTPTEARIAYENLVQLYWAQMSFVEPTAGAKTQTFTSGIPTKLTVFDTDTSSDDMTVSVGGSPLDSKITLVTTGRYEFSYSISIEPPSNSVVTIYQYWNGAAIQTSHFMEPSTGGVHTWCATPFVYHCNSASQDYEIYLETDTAGSINFYEGHAFVNKRQ